MLKLNMILQSLLSKQKSALIAAALGLRQRPLIDRFVAADKVLCNVAGLEAFSVLNPEIL